MAARDYILNQVFVGYPWTRIRPMFERKIRFLHIHYPLHFKAVWREYAQSATDLFEEIKREISRSSGAILDVTNGNPNVALEFGYAEALALDIVVTINQRKPPKHGRGKAGQQDQSRSAIVSDLRGRRVNEYRSQQSLDLILLKYTKQHPYVRRFAKLCKENRILPLGKRALLHIIHMLDKRQVIRREEIIQELLSEFPTTKLKVKGLKRKGYKYKDWMLNLLRKYELISVGRGRYAEVSIGGES